MTRSRGRIFAMTGNQQFFNSQCDWLAWHFFLSRLSKFNNEKEPIVGIKLKRNARQKQNEIFEPISVPRLSQSLLLNLQRERCQIRAHVMSLNKLAWITPVVKPYHQERPLNDWLALTRAMRVASVVPESNYSLFTRLSMMVIFLHSFSNCFFLVHNMLGVKWGAIYANALSPFRLTARDSPLNDGRASLALLCQLR